MLQAIKIVVLNLIHNFLVKIGNRPTEKQRVFLERFPCPDCRPDGCTFFHGIPCHCNTCGRNYEI